MGKKLQIHWHRQPGAKDYPAAENYLNLIFSAADAAKFARRLKAARLQTFRAVDLFRASQLGVFGVSDPSVEAERIKVRNREKLSPLLLVRDPARGKLVIADGYHRLCAVFSLDPDAQIPCKLV